MDQSPTEISLCPWPAAEQAPPLAMGQVHVWCAAIDVDESRSQGLSKILSEDERARAARFLFDRHRRRFIAGRSAQRLILSTYTGISPQDLQFAYSPLGKPSLVSVGSAEGLGFNVSNSGDLALVAIALQCDLGVDLERMRDNLDHDGLAQRFFAVSERDKLRSLPEDLRLRGFFDCWTRKEAFLKAIGKGLTYPLHRAVVSVGPEEPCRMLALDGREEDAAEWSLLALEPAAGYVAAVAVQREVAETLCFQWVWE